MDSWSEKAVWVFLGANAVYFLMPLFFVVFSRKPDPQESKVRKLRREAYSWWYVVGFLVLFFGVLGGTMTMAAAHSTASSASVTGQMIFVILMWLVLIWLLAMVAMMMRAAFARVREAEREEARRRENGQGHK